VRETRVRDASNAGQVEGPDEDLDHHVDDLGPELLEEFMAHLADEGDAPPPSDSDVARWDTENYFGVRR